VTVEPVAAKRSAIRGSDADFGMSVVGGELLEGCGVGQDHGALVREVGVFRLGGRVATEVVASEASAGGRGDSDLGARVVHGGLLERRRLGQHQGALVGVFGVVGLRGRGTAEVVAAEQRGIGGSDANFGMSVVGSQPLESRGVSQDLGALVREVVVLRLGSRVATEVIAAKTSASSRGDADLGAQVVRGGLLERRRLGQHAGALVSVFGALRLRGGGALEVAASEQRAVGGRDADLGTQVVCGRLLEGGGLGQDGGALVGEPPARVGGLDGGHLVLAVRRLRGGVAVEVVAAARGGRGRDADLGAQVVRGRLLERRRLGQHQGALLGVLDRLGPRGGGSPPPPA